MNTSSTDAMIAQLRDQLLASSETDIRQMVEDVQAEAMEEARTLLKERMLQSILEQALPSNDGASS